MHSRFFAVLLALGLAGCAGNAPRAAVSGPAADDTAGVLEVQRAWWRAFAVADTAYLQAHTAADFSLTTSGGATFDRAGMLAQTATHVNGGRLTMSFADEAARLAAPSVAVATTRSTEADGPAASSTFRYLTVMVRAADGWRVSAAQSTRELAFTPRVPATQAGALGDFVGAYVTPRGTELRVQARDSSLALIEPSGKELPMVPVGPALFELGGASPLNGVVRLMFTRDASGRVTSMSRLLNGVVNTFPRQAPPGADGLASAVGAFLVDSMIAGYSSAEPLYLSAPGTAFDSAVAAILIAEPRVRTFGTRRPAGYQWITTRDFTLRGDTAAVMVEVGVRHPPDGSPIDTYIEQNLYFFVPDGPGWRCVRREFVRGTDLGSVRG
ncbi:MAG TPA: nuclear transport factor 2 family protein [Longimicrobium sp.]|nr:nuclear transport factor 2 family protein [Longimicrobium sp.]